MFLNTRTSRFKICLSASLRQDICRLSPGLRLVTTLSISYIFMKTDTWMGWICLEGFSTKSISIIFFHWVDAKLVTFVDVFQSYSVTATTSSAQMLVRVK